MLQARKDEEHRMFGPKQNMHYVAPDDYEHRLVVNSLNDTRTALIKENKFHDAVDDVILKICDTPNKKFKVIEKEKDEAR